MLAQRNTEKKGVQGLRPLNTPEIKFPLRSVKRPAAAGKVRAGTAYAPAVRWKRLHL